MLLTEVISKPKDKNFG